MILQNNYSCKNMKNNTNTFDKTDYSCLINLNSYKVDNRLKTISSPPRQKQFFSGIRKIK